MTSPYSERLTATPAALIRIKIIDQQRAKMLCEYCDDVDLDSLWDKTGYQHRPSYNSLVNSAESGCSLCLLLAKSCETPSDEAGNDNTKDSGIERRITLKAHSNRNRVGVVTVEILGHRKCIDFFVPPSTYTE